MVPWILIGGAVIGTVALGYLIYTVVTAEQEKIHAYRGGEPRNSPKTEQVAYSDIRGPHKNSDKKEIRRRSGSTCAVCDRYNDAEFRPCRHRYFCRDHADYYIEYAKGKKRVPLCPVEKCRKAIESVDIE